MKIRDENDIQNICSDLEQIDGVLFAEPNMDCYLGNDEHYPKQWYLKNTGQSGGTTGVDIDAELVWKFFTGSPIIKIGIIDSGVELGHN